MEFGAVPKYPKYNELLKYKGCFCHFCVWQIFAEIFGNLLSFVEFEAWSTSRILPKNGKSRDSYKKSVNDEANLNIPWNFQASCHFCLMRLIHFSGFSGVPFGRFCCFCKVLIGDLIVWDFMCNLQLFTQEMICKWT